MKSKFALIASIVTLITLIVGLALTVVVLRQRQETRSSAQIPSASLSWVASPTTASVGDTIKVTITANSQTVSLDAAQLQISFDALDKVEVGKIGENLAVEPGVQFPTVIQAPTMTGSELRFAYGASANLAEVKGLNIEIVTITLKAKAVGTTRLTMVQLPDSGTRLSGSGNTGNLLASGGYPQPLSITVNGGSSSITPGTTISITPGADLTPAANTTPAQIPTPLPTLQSSIPQCNNLTLQPASGTIPLTVSLTGRGSIASPSAITASEFSYGEGANQIIEKNYGLAASESTTHTYQTVGNYQVFVRFRSNAGTWSTIPTECTGQVAVAPVPSRGPLTHFACQGGACIQVQGSGTDECNPANNTCKAAKNLDRLPTSGAATPGIVVVVTGIILLALGAVVLR